MRLLPLLALLLALPVSAQTWTLDGMLDEMVPVLLDAAETDFASFRGDLVSTRGADSLWASLYRPAGPSGPLVGRTSLSPSLDLSVFSFTVGGSDAPYVQSLYRTALASLDAYLGSADQGDGLGWTLAIAENSDVRRVAQWVECATVGRLFEATYTPTDAGAEVTVSLVRRGGQSCPPPEILDSP